jgi:predicted acylesterase/phospholipase RssA
MLTTTITPPSPPPTPPTPPTPQIQHLVFSGGGIGGLMLYGGLKETNMRGIWKHENIKSIHSVSAGSILSVIVALHYDWETTDKYIINRPWHKIFNFENINFLNIFYDGGIFDKSVFVEILTPLFRGMDISPEITMREFYEKTGVDCHFYCAEITDFKLIDICHTNYPELLLIDAVYRTCCIPVVFIPQRCGDDCFMDGYLITNYPSKECLDYVCATDAAAVTEDSILGFCLYTPKPTKKDNNTITNILDIIKTIITNIMVLIQKLSIVELKHQYEMGYIMDSLNETYAIISSPQLRKELIERGIAHIRGGDGDKTAH